MLLAELEGLCDEVAHQLHELVDPVMIDQVPFLVEMLQECFEEDDSVLFGQFEEEFRYLGVEVVLVDHFVEVPHPVEKRFYDVGKDVLLLY